MGDAVAMYVDERGNHWHVCAFWKPRVLAHRAEDPASEADTATVVFERPGEERVATTPSIHGWDSKENLRKLFLTAVERRSGVDRRSGQERRVEAVARAADLRTGEERRSADPRRRCDRRALQVGSNGAKIKLTPATYSREEAAQIRAMAMVGSRPICPRCEEDLCIGASVMRDGDAIRQLACPRCCRAVMVRGMG
jgi:hypothetical protein